MVCKICYGWIVDGQPPVGGQGLSGDVPGVFGGEEGYGGGDVLRFSQIGEGIVTFECPACFFRQVFQCGGCQHKSRCNGVAADVVTPCLGGDVAGQVDKCRFGCAVVSASEISGESSDGGDVDDVSPFLPEHGGDGELAQADGGTQVEVESPVEKCDVEGSDVCVALQVGATHVVDQDVYPPVFIQCLFYQAPAAFQVFC